MEDCYHEIHQNCLQKMGLSDTIGKILQTAMENLSCEKSLSLWLFSICDFQFLQEKSKEIDWKIFCLFYNHMISFNKTVVSTVADSVGDYTYFLKNFRLLCNIGYLLNFQAKSDEVWQISWMVWIPILTNFMKIGSVMPFLVIFSRSFLW